MRHIVSTLLMLYFIAEERRVYSNPVRLETRYFLCKTSSAYDYQPKSIKYLHYETLFREKAHRKYVVWDIIFPKIYMNFSILYQSTRIKRVLCCSASGICHVIRFNMRCNVFVSLGKKYPAFGRCVSDGCGGNDLILWR